MGQIIISLVFGVISLFFFITAGHYTLPGNANVAFWIFGAVFLIAGIIMIIAGVTMTLNSRGNQLNDIERLEQVDNVIVILQEKADNLVEEFKTHLMAYPDIEKTIFDKISPNNITLYLAQYPQIRSSEVLQVLAKEIAKLYSSVYDQRTYKEKILTMIRYRPQNPWRISKFIPVYSKGKNTN